MSDSSYNPDAQVPGWEQLEWFFHGLLILNSPGVQKGAASAWRPDWTRIGDRDGLVDAIRQAEAPHLADIEAGVALASTACDPDLTGICPEALGFLRMRAETCAEFLKMMQSPGTTLFPKPEASWQQAIQWMLVTWWKEHGPELRADTMLADRFGN